MIEVEEALSLVKAQKFKKISITRPVLESLGHCLAQSITAPFDLPNFDNSAMDGYAICGTASEYHLVGEIKAGVSQDYVMNKGEAYRIFTGAKVPSNCTAVIMQEKTRVDHTKVIIEDQIVKGKNIRIKGEQIAEGQLVLEEGKEIKPPDIGLLLTMGIDHVSVYKKPRIHIISTGDELIDPGTSLKPGQIYESNKLTLASAARQKGFEATSIEHLKDDFERIRDNIADHLNQCEVLLISGGISVGDYDFVKPSLEENGVQTIFYKVKQKPGKPLFFGRKGDTFVFALPGNPASALTCFYIYAYPLLQLISGFEPDGLKHLRLPLLNSYPFNGGRSLFLKARAELNDGVEILEGQGSSMLFAFTLGNALVYLSGPGKKFGIGDLVDVYLMD